MEALAFSFLAAWYAPHLLLSIPPIDCPGNVNNYLQVYKTVDWRLILCGGLVYGGLYALERWRWNSGAKEQHLKDQFRSHLAERMRGVSSAHTALSVSQVVRLVFFLFLRTACLTLFRYSL